jgi:PKD repeat protein
MHETHTARARRHARAVALTVVAVILFALLHSASLGSPPSARAASGSLLGAGPQHPLVNQADNCITSTDTIPPTPLPNALTQPTANAGGPYTGSVGNPILFVGSGTPSRNASIVTCIWSFGDGTTAIYLTPSHVYAIAGTFTATLTITDTSGATATASTTVTVGGFVPLCQQPQLTGNSGLQPCQTSGACIASTLNNACQTICAQTGEIFVPGNCPGPSTGNQITITGPYALQVEQSFTVNANLNLPAFSDLANADKITFDFGDGTAIVNAGSGSNGVVGTQTASTAASLGSSSASSAGNTTGTNSSGTSNGLAVAIPVVVGASPFFPAATQATHAYSRAGTYTITATVQFSNGTSSIAKTTATVSGAMLLPQAPPTVVAGPVQQVLIPLLTGCNHVKATFPDGTPITAVATSIQGAVLVSIYETPANAPALGYFPDPSAPSNLVSVRHGDLLSICVQGNGGVLSEPAS